MKRTITLLSLFSFVCMLSFGQTKSKKADVVLSQELVQSKKLTLSDVSGHDETGIYTVKTKRKGYRFVTNTVVLEHFNMKMSNTKSVEVVLGSKNLDNRYEFSLHLKGELYLFYTSYDERTKGITLYSQKVKKSILKPYGSPQDIAEFDCTEMSRYYRGEFFYKLSSDSSRLLIYYDLSHKSGRYKELGFQVYDDELNQLWEKEVRLPYNDELFDVVDYKVDNSGIVHLLGLIFKDKHKEKRKGEANYRFQIMTYEDEGDELIQYPITLEGKFITDMQIAITDDHDIICAGFFSNEGKQSIVGTYFIKVDGDTKEITEKSFKEFSYDFITQHMTNKEERKAERKESKDKKAVLYDYKLEEVILRDNGGAVLVGEQYYVTESHKVNSDGSIGTTYHYYFKDIIVVNITPDGNIDWAQKIAKEQVTVNDGGYWSSFSSAVVGNKLYFVFNDNPRNLYYKEGDEVHNFYRREESLVMLVEIDGAGNQSRDALFSSKEANVLMIPRLCQQISANEMVLYGERKKTNRFARIIFKQ